MCLNIRFGYQNHISVDKDSMMTAESLSAVVRTTHDCHPGSTRLPLRHDRAIAVNDGGHDIEDFLGTECTKNEIGFAENRR